MSIWSGLRLCQESSQEQSHQPTSRHPKWRPPLLQTPLLRPQSSRQIHLCYAQQKYQTVHNLQVWHCTCHRYSLQCCYWGEWEEILLIIVTVVDIQAIGKHIDETEYKKLRMENKISLVSGLLEAEMVHPILKVWNVYTQAAEQPKCASKFLCEINRLEKASENKR